MNWISGAYTAIAESIVIEENKKKNKFIQTIYLYGASELIFFEVQFPSITII